MVMMTTMLLASVAAAPLKLLAMKRKDSQSKLILTAGRCVAYQANHHGLLRGLVAGSIDRLGDYSLRHRETMFI